MTKYRRATEEEKENYGSFGCDPCYDLLVGPDGFECLLTEPEDRTWWRDGKGVVKELNRLADRVEELEQALAKSKPPKQGLNFKKIVPPGSISR